MLIPLRAESKSDAFSDVLVYPSSLHADEDGSGERRVCALR